MKIFVVSTAIVLASIANAQEATTLPVHEVQQCPSAIRKIVSKVQDVKALAKSIKRQIREDIRENTQDVSAVQDAKASYKALKTALNETKSDLKIIGDKIDDKVDSKVDRSQARLKELMSRSELGRDTLELLERIDADLEKSERELDQAFGETKQFFKSCKS